MSDRQFPNSGRMYCNEYFPVAIFGKITAAADVAANGYTVTEGGEFITSVTRTAEGVARILLSDTYNQLLSVQAILSLDDYTVHYTAEDVDGSTPYIDLTFRTGAADTDPDSAIIFLAIHLKNSVS